MVVGAWFGIGALVTFGTEFMGWYQNNAWVEVQLRDAWIWTGADLPWVSDDSLQDRIDWVLDLPLGATLFGTGAILVCAGLLLLLHRQG